MCKKQDNIQQENRDVLIEEINKKIQELHEKRQERDYIITNSVNNLFHITTNITVL